jgi:glycosyltransferase involved in cell wall biosynthesis
MKILHVVESFGGGVIEFLNQLSSGLTEHQHIILYAQREIPIENVRVRFASNCEFIEWRHAVRSVSLFKDFLAYRSLSVVTHNVKPDIIHLHSSKAGFIGRVWGLLNRSYKKRIIYTPNGLYFIRKDISKIKRYTFAFLEYFAGNCSGIIIGVSKSEQKAIKSLGLKAASVNNCIAPWAYDSKLFNKFEKFTIVTVGRVSAQKNPHSFRLIANAFKDSPDVQFIWVGEGELIDEFNGAKNIAVTGWIKAEQVREVLCSSHLYLSTALWEGLPFAVLEAMNAALPLALSNCVGNVDLINFQSQNGCIFEDEKQAISYIEQCLVDSHKCTNQGIASLKFLNQSFNYNSMLEGYNKHYINLHKGN